MQWFTGIRNKWRKSQAAVVVQNLLELQVKSDFYVSDPVLLANKLVGQVWDQKPDIYNGKFGQRPHRITVAAVALANGIDSCNDTDLNRMALIMSLLAVIAEIRRNGRLYPLNSLDDQLIEYALSVFMEVSRKMSETESGKEVKAFIM